MQLTVPEAADVPGDGTPSRLFVARNRLPAKFALRTAPKVAPFRDEMRRQIAQLLQVSEHHVNVKATTTERLGFLGRAEGIAAQAVALLEDG